MWLEFLFPLHWAFQAWLGPLLLHYPYWVSLSIEDPLVEWQDIFFCKAKPDISAVATLCQKH